MPLELSKQGVSKFMRAHRNRSEKGSAMLEFGLVVLLLVPLLFGTVGFGINLGNMLQSAQITRDVAHMYSRAVDFSLTQNKNIAVNLVQGMGGMTVNGGNGVLILSQVREVYLADCIAVGLSAGQCTNLGKRVFTNRIVIGNSSLRASNFGTPNATYVTADGSISSANYLTRTDLVATNFDDTVLPQADGDVAFVVEGYFATPDMSFLTSGFAEGNAGTYTRAIF